MQDSPSIPIAEIPDAVLVISRDGLIVSANAHAERLFGYSRNELAGVALERLVPERYRDRHGRLVGGFFAEPEPRPMGMGRELHGLKRDGKEFPVEIAIGPTAGGSFAAAVIRDITTTVQVRDALRESEAESRDLDHSFRNTPIGLCYFDKELRYVRVNDWLARINGLSIEEHLGRKIADVLPDVAKGVEAQLRGVLQTGEPILGGFVETTTPAHPTTTRTYMHNYFPNLAANGVAIGVFCVVQDVTDAKKDLDAVLTEVRELRDRLQAENVYFREEIKAGHDFEHIIGNSGPMRATLLKVEKVAPTDTTVLVLGETGTGKELLARAIHSSSDRSDRPLIKIDCGALAPGLVESELFGHEKGAFTGASQKKQGRFELAHNGTIFLDEIGELPLDLQTNLLRVLEEGVIKPVGSESEKNVDVRVIAASNRNLKNEVEKGRFRTDLYYRLSVFLIESPPLRDRREDIPLLTAFFMSSLSIALGKNIRAVNQTSMDRLMGYDWPGNIRELRNVLERAAILCEGDTLDVEDFLGPAGGHDRSLKGDLRSVERARILHALTESRWRIKGENNAASRLGLKPSTLRARMSKLGIERPH